MPNPPYAPRMESGRDRIGRIKAVTRRVFYITLAVYFIGVAIIGLYFDVIDELERDVFAWPWYVIRRLFQ